MSSLNWFKTIFAIDGYKTGHIRQYPPGAQVVYSNFTPRSVKHAATISGICDDKVVHFGLQYFLKHVLIEGFNRTFFAEPRIKVCAEYQRVMDAYLGKGAVDTKHIAELHELGYLPLSIRALPEGSVVDARVPTVTLYNTDERFAWLPGYIETMLSSNLWLPCTTATIARKYRTLLEYYATRTGGDMAMIDFQAHDFSYRGMHPGEAPAVTSAGHLLSFAGTDTVPALLFVEEFYNGNLDAELIGASVPATEHSVMCMSGKEGEEELFVRLLTEVYPTGIVSIVADTWDFWKVITELLPKYKDLITKRDGKLVIRPDSSPKTPYEIICGDVDAAYGSPEYLGAVRCLYDTFGGTKEGGFLKLDPHVGLIYGDSITLPLADKILAGLMHRGFSSTNVVLGIGSYTYAYNTRDALGWAMKATAGKVDGEEIEIFKQPKTDSGMKNSARGWLRVVKNDSGDYRLIDRAPREDALTLSEHREVFRDGKLLVDERWADIRKRVLASLPTRKPRSVDAW